MNLRYVICDVIVIVMTTVGTAGPRVTSRGVYKKHAGGLRGFIRRRVKAWLVHCWANVAEGGPTLSQHCVNVFSQLGPLLSEKSLQINTRCSQECSLNAGQCSVIEGGSILKVYWVNVLCLLSISE